MTRRCSHRSRSPAASARIAVRSTSLHVHQTSHKCLGDLRSVLGAAIPASTVMPLFLAAVISLLHSTRVASTCNTIKLDIGYILMVSHLPQHARQHPFPRTRSHEHAATGCTCQLLPVSQTRQQTHWHVKVVAHTERHAPRGSVGSLRREVAELFQPAQTRAAAQSWRVGCAQQR
jgi:hypothetical protein